jgi:hypothetical protein
MVTLAQLLLLCSHGNGTQICLQALNRLEAHWHPLPGAIVSGGHSHCYMIG